MKPYAELPGRVARQLVADVLALAWLAGVGWVAHGARALILMLQTPLAGLSRAGAGISEAFGSAARTAVRVPLVGDSLGAALNAGRAAGQSLVGLGAQQSTTVGTLALGTAVLVALAGATPVLLTWLPLRLHYARTAAAAAATRARDVDLLALRALSRSRVSRLRAVTDEPAAAWRRGDPEIIRRLAAVELRRLGLRAPS